jgi:hypothetical protein
MTLWYLVGYLHLVRFVTESQKSIAQCPVVRSSVEYESQGSKITWKLITHHPAFTKSINTIELRNILTLET